MHSSFHTSCRVDGASPPDCNTLQHTATLCNALQRTYSYTHTSCRVDGASPADCTPFVEAFDCSSACNCNSAPNTCVCAKEALAIRDTSSSIPSSRRTPPSSSPRFLPALALPPSCSLSTAALGAGCGVKIIPETGGGDSSPPPECWCGCVGCEATCMLGWDRAVEELLSLVGCDGVMLVGCDGVMMIPETGSSPPVVLQFQCNNASFTHTHAHAHAHAHAQTHTRTRTHIRTHTHMKSSDRSTYHPKSGG